MSRPQAKAADQVIETWEILIPGSVYVWVYEKRDDRYRKQRVGGTSGSRRLHISRDDRKYNQELIPVENRAHDAFTNGALRLVESSDRDEHLDIRYHYTDQDLAELFEVRDTELFIAAVKDIDSELIIRRLAAMAEVKATVAQNEALKELVSERYPIGGTQATVREMIEAGERIGALGY